jgi:hypothetical protein
VSARKGRKPRPILLGPRDVHRWSDDHLASVPYAIANRIANLRAVGEHAQADCLQHELTFWETVARLCPVSDVVVEGFDAWVIRMAQSELRARGLPVGSPVKLASKAQA